jgi:diacylglycerol kinase (ATP)
MKKKVLIIANPIAGRATAERRAQKLLEILNSHRIPAELFFTHIAGDGGKKAREVDSHVRTVVISGGDGTINEVLNGLPHPSRVPIAILPTGTANMLARELRLPASPQAVAGMIQAGVVKRIDMGLVENKRFLLLASAGFDAMVTEEVSRSRGGALGYRGYVIPIVKVLGRYKKPELQISVDGKRVTGGLVMVFKIRNYGGLFQIDAIKEPDSGKFEICVFRGGTLPEMLWYSLAMIVQKIRLLPDVTCLSGKNITIESMDDPVPVEVDGDYFGTTPVQITMKPAHVPIIIPGGNHGS